MQNQKLLQLSFVNFSQFKSILSLYLFTTGSTLLGFSLYLLLETLGFSGNNIIAWSGQGLFWGLILFFVSIFVLFFPIEFLNFFELVNKSFSELISNILFTISISLFFLVFFQLFLPNSTLILAEVSDLIKATSFAGFIIIPIALFLFNNLSIRVQLLNNLGYSLILLIWILGTLVFI